MTEYILATGSVKERIEAELQAYRETERRKASVDVAPAFQIYLKNLRLFVQYVTMRHRCFLAEFDPQERYNLHELVLEAMLSGNLGRLCQCLDAICGKRQSFSRLFKMVHYSTVMTCLMWPS